MSNSQRKKWIDLAKGIAMFVVMLNHSTLEVPGIRFWGGMFFVPVFFVLSGYTHHTREESYFHVWGRKAKRLLLPYITANGILFAFFLLKDILFGVEFTWDRLGGIFGILYSRNQLMNLENQTFFFPGTDKNLFFLTNLNSPTWFLTALFMTVMLFEALLRLTKKNGRKMLLAAVILLCLANLYHYLFPYLLPWSLDSVPYFLIMFMWGYFMAGKEYLEWFHRHKWVLLLLFAGFVVSALVNGSANYSIGGYGKSAMLALYNALVSSTVLMYICSRLEGYIPRVFTLMGQQSMFLLCYHLIMYSVIEILVPGISPILVILITAGVLTAVGMGKEWLIHGKKQRS